MKALFVFCTLVLLAFVFLTPTSVALAASPTDGFDPGANSTVRAFAVQPDGKIVVGGFFTSLGGGGTGTTTRNYIGRLNADGSLDTSFDPGTGPNNWVYTLAVQPDGKILVGGNFNTIDGVTRNFIGRLNADGSLDAAFNPSALGIVYALELQPDGKILVGGAFGQIGGASRAHVARLNADGSLDTTFDPGAGANNTVLSLALQPDGKILLGGSFNTLGGVTNNFIGRLNADGSLDTAFNPGASGQVSTLAVQPDGKILVGGAFATLVGATRNFIGRLNADGSLDTAFNPGANSTVNTLALQADGKILVGGAFTALGGVSHGCIGRLNPDGSLDASFNPTASSWVYALALQPDGQILVGGAFGQIGATTRYRIARLNANGSLDANFNPGANNQVWSLAAQPDGKVVVGGWFSSLGGTARSYIGRVNPDGSLDTSFNPGASSIVYALAVQPDAKILVGGSFVRLGGGGTGITTRNYIGRLNADGSLDTAFDPGANNPVNMLAVQPDGKILVAGGFTSLGGAARNRIGRLNADGTLDTSFADPAANNVIWTLAVQPDGKILVGGGFTSLGGTGHGYIGRLNADGSLDTTFNPGANGSVSALAVQPDGKILVGGTFTTLGGGGTGASTRNRIGRLNADGSLDNSFDPGANGQLASLELQPDGKIVVAGLFTMLGGGGTGTTARNYIARLNADGSLDTTFNPDANNQVLALALQPDGKLVAGGMFTTLGGMARNRIGRLSTDAAALQAISVNGAGTTLTWARSGSGPEVSGVTFEQSTDGTTYTSLGNGTRVAGGWQRSGLNLPHDQNLYLRARGSYATGYANGSGSMVERVQLVYLAQVSCYPLSVTVNPTDAAGVTVNPTPNCNNGTKYTAGTNVTLTAQKAKAYYFSHWSGDASGTGQSVSVIMTGDKSVTANYTPICYTLTTNVNPSGAGTVAADPAPNCNNGTQYTAGTSVSLTATANSGYVFGSWSGDATGTADHATVFMSSDNSVTANFTQSCYSLTTSVSPNGAGSVAADPVPNCNGGTQYTAGTSVSLTAHANTGYIFSSWSGDASGTASPTSLIMDGDKSVTAAFEVEPGLFSKTNPTNGATGQPSNPTLTWETSAGATSYEYCYDATVNNTCDGTWTSTTNATAPLSGLTAGKTYEWHVRAKNSAGIADSNGGSWWSFITQTACYTLTTSVNPSGAGTVAPDPAPNCNNGTQYAAGTSVSLTAQASSGYSFGNWSGDAGGAANPTTLMMDGDKSVTANWTARTEDTVFYVGYNTWRGRSDPNAVGGTYRVSKAANATATFKFKGTSIIWVTKKGPDQGKAQVLIDGVSKGTVDLYSSSEQWQFKRAFSKLANTNHTLVVKLLGTKNQSSTGKNVVVDGFIVGSATTQDTDSAIQYNSWVGVASPKASGSSYRRSATAGATVTLTFSGTSVDWITARGPAYGKAVVLIDGQVKQTVDLYAGTQQWQVKKSYVNLGAGTHTLQIRVLGAKNIKSTGKTVVVDAFSGPVTLVGTAMTSDLDSEAEAE